MTERDDHRTFVRERWPEVGATSFEPIFGGWDFHTYVVDGMWVFQFPRLAGSEERLRKQISALPELAREVSAAIPVPRYVDPAPPCMGYRMIEGEPMRPGLEGPWPERLGRFLYDLHLAPPEFVGMRGSTAAVVHEDLRREVAELSDHVLPLLDPRHRTMAEALVDRLVGDDGNFRFSACLTHGDIGPEHVLVTGDGDLAGVIDWGDLAVGDPAGDFAWIVHAMPAEGARTLAAYGGPPDDRFLERCRALFILMPWHEVMYGALTGQPAFVESGLEGVRDRLE